jgi:hypothetical protein
MRFRAALTVESVHDNHKDFDPPSFALPSADIKPGMSTLKTVPSYRFNRAPALCSIEVVASRSLKVPAGLNPVSFPTSTALR